MALEAEATDDRGESEDRHCVLAISPENRQLLATLPQLKGMLHNDVAVSIMRVTHRVRRSFWLRKEVKRREIVCEWYTLCQERKEHRSTATGRML